jgi:hypothetical protein
MGKFNPESAANKAAKQKAKQAAKQAKFRRNYKKRQQKIEAKATPAKNAGQLKLQLEREAGKTLRTGQFADVMKQKYVSDAEVAKHNRDSALAYYNAQIGNKGDSVESSGSSNDSNIGDTNEGGTRERY